MSILSDAGYWVKRTLMGLYGPAQLDEKNDPVEQLKREHEGEGETHDDEGEHQDGEWGVDTSMTGPEAHEESADEPEAHAADERPPTP